MFNAEKHGYNIISEYRQEIFGIAIISIIIFHYTEDAYWLEGASQLTYIFCRCWYHLLSSVGVDVFAFLSGMGVYHSMCANSNVKTFYYKRLKRVLVPYFIVGGVFWFIRDLFLEKTGWLHLLYDLSLLSFWKEGNKALWYIAFIVAAYILFPGAYFLAEKNTKYRNLIIIVIMITTCIFTCIYGYFYPESLANIEIAIGRFLAFELGFLLGKSIRDNDEIKKFHIVTYIFCIFVCVLAKMICTDATFKIVITRWRNAFYGLILILISCIVLEKIRNQSILKRVLRWFGRYTLELYLLHVSVRAIMNICGFKTAYIHNYGIVVILTFLLLPLAISAERRTEKALAFID